MEKDITYTQFLDDCKTKFQSNPASNWTYDLQIYKDDNRFVLFLPNTGGYIEDQFDEFSKRKHLYYSLENQEIFNWLQEIHELIKNEAINISPN
jgi:hypothetical protein